MYEKYKAINCSMLLTLMFAELEKIFGKQITCTIAYYIGKSLGNAIHNVTRKLERPPSLLKKILNELIKMGIVSHIKLQEMDDRVSCIEISGVNIPMCRGKEEYPIIRGLADAFAENGFFSVTYKGKGRIEIILFIKQR